MLIESKYAVGAAVVGFMLALLLSRASLIAGLGSPALIAGIGWAAQRIFQSPRMEHENE